jgi:predicted DNA-binding protein (UPF0251 family)
MKVLKELFNQYRNLKRREEEIYNLINGAVKGRETAAQGVQQGQMLEEVVQASARRVSALTDELEELFKKMDSIQHTVWNAGLTEKEEEAVRLRYMEGMTHKQAASSMGYSERMIIRLIYLAEEKIVKVRDSGQEVKAGA